MARPIAIHWLDRGHRVFPQIGSSQVLPAEGKTLRARKIAVDWDDHVV